MEISTCYQSRELGLSAFSINCHYLELYTYLSEVMTDPDIVFKQDYHVLISENRLYESDSKVNHRLNSPFVYDVLFQIGKFETTYLCTLIVKGATAMKEK